MDSEGLLPQSHVPVTCPYLEPARSSPHTQVQLPEDPSKYYLLINAWVSQVVSFLQVSLPHTCVRLSAPPYMPYLTISPLRNPFVEKAREYKSLECGILFFIDKTPCGMLRVRWCDIVLITHVSTEGKTGK